MEALIAPQIVVMSISVIPAGQYTARKADYSDAEVYSANSIQASQYEFPDYRLKIASGQGDIARHYGGKNSDRVFTVHCDAYILCPLQVERSSATQAFQAWVI